MDKFAINFDMIALSGLCAEICADLTVDPDATGRDQFVTFSTRTNAGRSKKAIQAHGVVDKLNRSAPTTQRLNRSTVLDVRLGLGQSDDSAAFFPLAALLEQFDTLETFQDVAFRHDGTGSSKAAML